MKALTPIARTVSVVVLAVLATSCGTGGTSDGKASAARSGSSLAEGKRLYLTRCTSCHAPEPVGDFTVAEWRSLMPEMAEEAKLTSAQQSAVLEYVLSHF